MEKNANPSGDKDTVAGTVNQAADLSAPQTFREMSLTAAWRIYQDIHVNLSGLVFFGVLAYGVIRPAAKPQCQEIAALAGTYLFVSAKNK
jgi:hypothetical protein